MLLTTIQATYKNTLHLQQYMLLTAIHATTGVLESNAPHCTSQELFILKKSMKFLHYIHGYVV